MNRTVALFTLGIALLALVGAGSYLFGREDSGEVARPALPGGWSLYTNRRDGFAIGYPGGWDRHVLRDERVSVFFDPKPIPPYPPFGGTALEVYFEAKGLDKAVEGWTEGEFTYVSPHSVEEVSVGDYRAVRLEGTATGVLWHSDGARVYAYFVERTPGTVVVLTTTERGDPRHAARKQVVDAAVQTLYFFEVPDRGPCRVPRLLGLTLREARMLIRARGCKVGLVRRARSPRWVGRVIGQNPRPRAVRRGLFPINLIVGRR